MRLKDKVAVVTGAGSGIGRATALLFAREGARVVLGEISPERGGAVARQIEQEGGRALFEKTDIGDRQQIEALFEKTLASFGRVDVLVNNAYGSLDTLEKDGDLLEVQEEIWDEIMVTALKSVYLASQCAVRRMVESGGGSIVNISSVNGLFAYGLAAYSTAKGGIVALTRCASVQYADKGVRMNAICPGTVETSSTRPTLEQPDQRRRINAMYPRGRLGQPEEIAAAALFLASEESSFVNGAVFVVDGALTVGPRNFELAEKTSRAGAHPDENSASGAQ